MFSFRLPLRRVAGAVLAGALALLAAALPCGGAAAGAAEPQPMVAPPPKVDFKLSGSAGLGGLARLGWVPVTVAVEAAREFEGDLVVRLRADSMVGGAGGMLFETRRGLKLAAGSKTEHHLYIRHDSPGLANGTVEVFLEDGRPLADTVRRAPLSLVPSSDYLVCVAADRPLTLGALAIRRNQNAGASEDPESKAERQFTVAQPALAELPDRVAGYNDVDFLLLYQTPFERLKRDQIAAIGDYLWRGGCVVLAARDRAWFSRGEVQELVAIRAVSAASPAEAGMLTRLLAERYKAPFAGDAASGTVYRFDIPGSRDDRGFYEARRGLGTVLVWRLDPAHNVVGMWPGMARLWTELAAEKLPPRPTGEGHNWGGWDESGPLVRSRELAAWLNLSRERSVPGLLIVFLVVLYLVLVGPVNYFVLRRLDMRALSIVTLPLLAAVFVLLNFAAGYISRGVVSSGRRVTVAVAPSGSARADCVTWLGLFPASSSLADLSTDGRGLLLPLSDTSLSEHSGFQAQTYTAERESGREERFMLERYPLAMWKMFHFQTQSTRPLGGAVKLVDLGGGRFSVANGTPLDLRGCFVAASPGGADFCWIGELPSKGQRTGSLERWAQQSGGQSGSGRQMPPLSLSGAFGLWMDGRLGTGRSYVLLDRQEGFAPQAGQVIGRHLESLRFRGLALFARVEGEELDDLRLDGRTPRGEGACVLVVPAEEGYRP